jgi:Zn-ribbon RNA-binding protein
MSEKFLCSSCKKDITNDIGSVKFNCPGCSKTEIIRCKSCRQLATKYTCHECGFVGPN